MRFDPISFIEQTHAGRLSNRAWLKELVSSAAALDQGFGVGAFLTDASDPQAIRFLDIACPNRRWFEEGIRSMQAAPPGFVEATYKFGADVLSRRQRGVPFSPKGWSEAAGIPASNDYDALGIIGTDPSRVGCILFVPVTQKYRPAPRTLHVLRKVSAHLAAAGRLRIADGPAQVPDAVLSPDGRMLDGTERTYGRTLRDEFRAKVRAMDKARGQLRRTCPDDALELWTGMVAGEWSLVEHEEQDGKRYLLAKRNPPNVSKHLSLSDIESAVASYCALGHSTKFIGYELGVAPSTVSTHLRNVLAKLRLQSRSALVRLFARAGGVAANANDAPPGIR